MRKMLAAGILLLAAIVLIVPPAISQIQTVKVTGGEVQGVVTDGIVSFKGIPFAAAPVGEMRWKAPKSVVAWTGVRKAGAFAPGCM